eukprot:TRINITY_DN6513_c0_g1_i2.p1 TRINITY_DN6513_c0_g1~~TRINITY_DN6513_c0_g1_i2.p1  ORF type:complete len:794 (-),score=177.10 TRINITY_DN6513_c0_g1_i2:48-2429(-)
MSSSSSAKRKVTTSDLLTIMPIGAGNEVGRSCIILQYKGKTVMFDCGIHPAHSGLPALPYFDMIDDPSAIDLLLVSHFHLDHAAAVPYFLEKTSFKGRVFMTHPTKAIYKMLLTDYVKVSNIAIDDMLFDEQDLNRSLDKVEQVNYHQEVEVNGIKFWTYNAGHVLGAAMFMVEIAGVRILYTGDFSRQEDRHLMAAEIPNMNVDVLIVESTYGVQVHEARVERERRFTGIISDIVRRGGRCLIPVFALGRAQELLLILDEYWSDHPELHNIPIYYASSLAKKCMKVYETYINMMNERVQRQFDIGNPFKFKHISNLKGMGDFDDSGACVVMASPGMLQSGLSRELFEKWCSDKRNGVLLPGYSVEGTLAKHILSEPAEITTSSGLNVPLEMSVDYISFSAHSDFLQTSEFIDILQPPHVVLVHGDANEMARLKSSLVQKYEGKHISVHSPRNCQTVELQFRSEKVAKIVGSLAAPFSKNAEDKSSKEGKILSGIVVRKDFAHTIMAPTDLATFTQLKTNIMLQRLTVPFHHTFVMLRSSLGLLYDGISLKNNNEQPCLVIHNCVNVIQPANQNHVIVEWSSNPVNDMIADSVVAMILQTEGNPSSDKGLTPLIEPMEDINKDNNSTNDNNENGENADKSENKDKEGENSNTSNSFEDNLKPEMRRSLEAKVRKILEAQYGKMDEVLYDEKYFGKSKNKKIETKKEGESEEKGEGEGEEKEKEEQEKEKETEVEENKEERFVLKLALDSSFVLIDVRDGVVITENAGLKDRITTSLNRARAAVFPIAETIPVF